MNDANVFDALALWFQTQCNGDWEHANEIRIVSLDNPGWRITVPIRETYLETRLFEHVAEEQDEDHWFKCWRTDTAWEAACSPVLISEAISRFVVWAEEPQASPSD